MKLLAIDQATSSGTVALLRDGNVEIEQGWEDGRFTNQRLFSLILNILESHGTDPAEIGAFAVNIGPGSFTGIRTSLAAARGMALPGGKRVLGVCSGRAIAMELLAERHTHAVTVVGDARRGRLWATRLLMDGDVLAEGTPYQLLTPEELNGTVHQGDLVATPDWDRLGGQLPALIPRDAVLVEGPRIPRAAAVGQLAVHDLARGAIPHATPIYLHPPVFVRPVA